MKLESGPDEKRHEKPEGERRVLVIDGTGDGNARPVGCGDPDAGDRV